MMEGKKEKSRKNHHKCMIFRNVWWADSFWKVTDKYEMLIIKIVSAYHTQRSFQASWIIPLFFIYDSFSSYILTLMLFYFNGSITQFSNLQIIKCHFKSLCFRLSPVLFVSVHSNLYGGVVKVGGWSRLNEQLCAAAATATISPVAFILPGSLGSFPSRSALCCNCCSLAVCGDGNRDGGW